MANPKLKELLYLFLLLVPGVPAIAQINQFLPEVDFYYMLPPDNRQWMPEDGKRVATGSRDNTAKIWEVRTGKELLTMRSGSGDVYGLAWSASGRRLVTAHDEGTITVWDSETGQELRHSRRSQLPQANSSPPCSSFINYSFCSRCLIRHGACRRGSCCCHAGATAADSPHWLSEMFPSGAVVWSVS